MFAYIITLYLCFMRILTTMLGQAKPSRGILMYIIYIRLKLRDEVSKSLNYVLHYLCTLHYVFMGFYPNLRIQKQEYELCK